MTETVPKVWRWIRRWFLSSDIGVVYALILFAVTAYLTFAPDSVRENVIAFSSTNLRNLRLHPLAVLALSAFIVPTFSGLVSEIPLMLLAFGIAQRTLGRATLLISAAFGHIGATLFVSVLLRSGISRGFVDPAVRFASDVGVSYAVFGVAGVCTMWFGRALTKSLYVAAVSLYLLGYVLFSRTFTDVGHLSAWVIGLCMACVAGTALRKGEAAT